MHDWEGALQSGAIPNGWGYFESAKVTHIHGNTVESSQPHTSKRVYSVPLLTKESTYTHQISNFKVSCISHFVGLGGVGQLARGQDTNV